MCSRCRTEGVVIVEYCPHCRMPLRRVYGMHAKKPWVNRPLKKGPEFGDDDIANEAWRPSPIPRVEVSSLGRLRRTSVTGAILDVRTGSKQLNGYIAHSGRLVHVMVLEAFVGPRPDGYHAAHEDGTRDNNRLSNLAWKTPAENAADRRRHGTVGSVLDEHEHLLGSMPDAVIAEMAGCSRQMVAIVRAKRGIPAMGPAACERWHRDRVVADVVGRLGREPDRVLAASIGVPEATITQARRERGIAPAARAHGTGRLAPYIGILGTMPDRMVAEMAGVSHVGVCKLRTRLGIPSFGPTRTKPQAALFQETP